MASTYVTKQGQTWDEIALIVYGDEIHADYLMKNNYDLLDILVFSSGTVLNTPDLPEEEDGEAPPWRTEDEFVDGIDPYDL